MVPIFFLTISSLSFGDVKCIGDTSCKIIGDASIAAGLSLPIILGELDNNVVKPIEANQNIAQTDELTRIMYTPNGSDGNTKISLGGSLVLGEKKLQASVIGHPFVYEQKTGSTTPVIIVEWGELHRNHILNLGFKMGPIDYVTGLINLESEHLVIRAGYGERILLLGNEAASLSLLLGGAYAYSHLSALSSPGSTINIITQYGQVKWEGDEKYSHALHVIGATGLLVSRMRLKNFTIGLDAGLTPTYSLGYNSLSKVGAIGPFFGLSGFFNVGVETSSHINLFTLIQRLNLTEEWEFTPNSTLSLSYGPPLLNELHKGTIFFSHTF